MMRGICIVACLFAASAQAKTEAERNQYYPTNAEVYQECQSAVALGKQEKWEDFFDSRCAVRLTSSLWSAFRVLHYIGVEPLTERQKIENEVLQQFASRVCVLKQLNKNEPAEFQLAVRFLSKIDKMRKDYPHFAESFETERNPAIILYAYDDPCTMEQP